MPMFDDLFLRRMFCHWLVLSRSKTVSGQYFWDPDEEGEVFVPPQDGSKAVNPIKVWCTPSMLCELNRYVV